MIAHDQTFTDITVCLDGATFSGCTFERCKLVYSGILAVFLAKNTFNDCSWEFSGPAQNTIGFMTELYAGGAKELIESTFENIKENAGTGKRAGDPVVKN